MGIGRRPSLKRPALALARRKKALELLVECKSLTAIGEELGISVQSVRKHLRKALETDSLFPPSLDADQVGQLRQIEAERLIKLWEKTRTTMEVVQPRIGTKREKNLDVMAVARLIEAGNRVSQQTAALFGLNAPTKVVEEQLRFSYHKSDSKITISFDRSPIDALAQVPVPGLEIKVGASLNGQMPAHVLEPAAVSTNGNSHTAAELPGAPESALNDFDSLRQDML